MKSACALLVLVTLMAAEGKTIRWSFEDATVGKLPQDWTAAKTGEGEGSVWKVVEDAGAPNGPKVLAQTAESPGAMFNLCIADEFACKDLELSVAFKSVQGEGDQGGGVLWRYKDANNYYVARYNPLESNFRVYKIVDGKRTQLATKGDLKFPPGGWHTLSITMKGDAITCALDGKQHLEAKDGTFADAGKVGLWTKADARTYFDDFRARETK